MPCCMHQGALLGTVAALFGGQRYAARATLPNCGRGIQSEKFDYDAGCV